MRHFFLLALLFCLQPSVSFAGADSGVIIDAGVNAAPTVERVDPEAEKKQEPIVQPQATPEKQKLSQVSQRTLDQDWSGRMMGLVEGML